MKYLYTLLITFVIFAVIGMPRIIAKDLAANTGDPVLLDDISVSGIKKRMEVTGIVYGPKITNAAIIRMSLPDNKTNSKIMWEGMSYTYQVISGKIVTRTRLDARLLNAKITLLKVNAKGAHLEYTRWNSVSSKTVKFTMQLKKQ